MKNLIILASLILLALACKKTIISSDLAAIKGGIDDIVQDEGIGVYQIDLNEAFSVKGDASRIITHRILEQSNPVLLSAQINNSVLEISLNPGEVGSSLIKIRSETNGVFKITEFNFTVNPITAQQAMDLAVQHFKAADYALSLSHFKLVTRKDEPAFYSDAFLGQGFSKMRYNSSSDDLGYNDFLQSLAFDNSNTAAIAGLSLLEFAQNRNYDEAILKANELLQKDGDFIFKYDTNLDKNDILLNKALSQFNLKNYEACLQTVQTLDSSYTADSNSSDFAQQLLDKLNELILFYS
jgi:hypothetical protein